jgi:Cellulose biosynthesis protein BcsS
MNLLSVVSCDSVGPFRFCVVQTMMMRRSLGLFAKLVLGLAGTSASAADMVVKAPVAAAAVVDYGNLYFGTDVNTNGGLVGYGGILYAPGGMDVSGVRFALFGLYGKYRYNGADPNAPTTFNGRFASVDALVGYSAVVNNGAVTLAIGANYQDQRVNPFDPDNPVQGQRVGFKVQGDFWTNPTERTVVVGIASYSTAFNTYYSILRGGYDFFGLGFFIGPEVGALGNARTDQQRVGLAFIGIPVAKRVALSLSGGWLHERNERDGGYFTANLDFTF